MKAFFKLVAFMVLSAAQVLAPLKALILQGEAHFFEDWSAEQVYTEDYAVTVEKDPDKDFVILNLTDIQVNNFEAFAKKGVKTTALLDELVEKTKPDLITVTGDDGWSMYGYVKVITDVDKYGIPWAPVMGNHDGEKSFGEFWHAYQYLNSKNCLFKCGPKDMGYGNYIINITENGQIIHTLYMMDTHSKVAQKDSINGPKGGYDHLWENQIEWYKWAVNGTTALAGHTVESTVFLHIPLCEYRQYESHTQEETFFGENRENVCTPAGNNGFFGVCRELGSTKNVLCGHDHINSVSFVLDGIRLSYALKSGYGSYTDADMIGGTTLTVNAEGTVTVQHVYCDEAIQIRAEAK